MEQHSWPGNVRKLMNRPRCAMIIADGKLLMPAALGLQAPGGAEIHNALDDNRPIAENRVN